MRQYQYSHMICVVSHRDYCCYMVMVVYINYFAQSFLHNY